MKFIVFYLQFINSLEGLGMFLYSAAIIRRLRRYTATLPMKLRKKHQQKFYLKKFQTIYSYFVSPTILLIFFVWLIFWLEVSKTVIILQ